MSQKELDDSIQAHEEAKASVLSASAGVESAEINLGFTRITAPIDGVVGVAKAQIGNLVGPNDELTSMSTLDPIRVYVPISEQEYLQFADRIQHAYDIKFPDPDSPNLELILADGTRYPHTGRFFLADRQVDVSTGTIRVARGGNPGNRLRPGQYAKWRTAVRTAQGALLVPQRAVMELQGTSQVAVVKPDGAVELRSVKVGDRIGSLWIVEQGLGKDERVVTVGLQKIKAGLVVKAKLTQPEPNAIETASAASPSPNKP